MFSSNKNKINIASLSSPIEDEVYVMPEKFQAQKSQASANKILATSVTVLLLVAMSSLTYFIYDWQKNKKEISPAVNQNIALENINTNINTNENRNVNVNENVNDNTNIDNANTNADLDVNANTNSSVNTNTALEQLIPPVKSGDADRDGLTDLEEALIGSSPSSPDSDGDGYLDSDELVGGYNPVIKPSSGQPFRLVEAGFISQLVTNFSLDNFQTLYIKGWSLSLLEALHEARIITGTGEMIKIAVINNPDQLSAANWYLVNHPQIALSQLSNLEFGDFKGVRSPSGLSVYLTNAKRDRIYAFDYDLDNMSELRYPTIFEMIIRNFKLISTPINFNVGLNQSQATSTEL